MQVQDFEQRFVVVTNASAEIQKLINTINSLSNPSATDLEKNKILSYLKVELGLDVSWNAINASDFKALPMCGETEITEITSTNQVPSYNITVVRMLARIDVRLAETRVGTDGSTMDISAITTGKLKLKSVRLYNYNDRGNIASPNLVNNVATATSIPADAQKDSSKPLLYTDFGNPGKTDVAMVGTIYTFEAINYDKVNNVNMNPLDATCLVIGGYFEGDTNETYYRIDFTKSDNATYIDILRNYVYSFNIVGVSGRGEETPELAFKSKSANIKVEVVEWNTPNMNDVVFDGQNLLSVSKNNFTFSSDAITIPDKENSVTIFTDYISFDGTYNNGWEVLKIENVDPTTNEVTDITEDENKWINLSEFSGPANQSKVIYFTTTENKTGKSRKAIIWLSAGNLRYAINVTQTIYPELLLLVTDAGGEIIEELEFDGENPKEQVLNVNWTPKTSALNVISNSVTAIGFPSNAGAPVTGEITGANGTKTYTILPTKITDQEVALNPFIEKTLLVNFVVGNGVASQSKTVFIRQKKYDIVAYKSEEYPIDGGVLNNGTANQKLYGNLSEITSNDNSGKLKLDAGYLLGPDAQNFPTTVDPNKPPRGYILFPASGEATGGEVKSVGSSGYLWTATSRNSTLSGDNNQPRPCVILFNENKVNQGTYKHETSGCSVRCVRAE